MVSWSLKRRHGPIGIDLGTQSIKLMQFSADQKRLVDAVRWDLGEPAAESTAEQRVERLAEALGKAREGRKFRGREAVLCLGARELFVQNIRVVKPANGEIDRVVRQEAAGKLPYPLEEADIRYLQAADVRQGEVTKREVILLACQKQVLEESLKIIQTAGLRPVAVDVEPNALLRCYVKQFRRDEDRQQRAMFVHVGATNTIVVIARGGEALFIKYIDIGGRQMDESVSRHLKMSLSDATALRRNNGDRRADQQDPEIARSVAEATRAVVDRLAGELSLCIRYHSVTFRGQPLMRLVLGGGEATAGLVEAFAGRLDLKCELGDPLRSYETAATGGRKGQWDVAAGLALRDFN